jgi:arsenate reductase
MVTTMNKTKVLFPCTGNSARSQMAEAFLRRYAGDRFDVYGAGLQPKGIHPMTEQVMEEIGFDLASHRSKDINQFLGQVHFGYLITVCRKAEEGCPIFPGVSVRLFWDIEDPVASEGTEQDQLSKFREVRDKIDALVNAWLAACPDSCITA